MRALLVAGLLLLALAVVPAAAAAQAAQAAPASSASAASTPVPVPSPSARAQRYYRTANAWWVVGTVWELALPVLLLWTGLSARLRDLAAKLGGRRWIVTIAIYGVLFALLSALFDLPLAWYAGFVREHSYGLSDQTAAKWWSDAAKGLALSCFGTAILLWMPYWLLRKSPRRWWLYTGLGAIPLLALVLVITPIWIEPLFNHFGPMKDHRLEAQVLALAERAGISGSRVYEVDASADTNTINAYVNGFLGTKRIVLWDTLLRKLAPRQVLVIMGHEMGHYVLGHVVQGLLLGSALTLLGLWFVHRTAGALLARFGGRFGFSELADVASVPLVLLLLSLASLAVEPLYLAWSRHTEHEADRFGLEITHDKEACATAFVRLQQENLSVPRPGPLYRYFRASHPSLGERIDFCNEYRPWAQAKPTRYVR